MNKYSDAISVTLTLENGDQVIKVIEDLKEGDLDLLTQFFIENLTDDAVGGIVSEFFKRRPVMDYLTTEQLLNIIQKFLIEIKKRVGDNLNE